MEFSGKGQGMFSIRPRRVGAWHCAASLILSLLTVHVTGFRANAATFTGLQMANHSSVSINASGGVNDNFVRSDGAFFGSHTISPAGGWAGGSIHSGETLVMHSTGVAGFVGDSTLDVGPAGAISPAVVHTFTHHLELFSPTNQAGFSGLAQNPGMHFLFTGVDAANPLYWGVEWRIETDLGVPAGHTSWAIRRGSHNGDFGIVTEVLNNTIEGVVTGSAFGQSFTNLQNFALTTSNFGNISQIDAVYRIAFSDTPFEDIPDTRGATAMPTPAAFGGGLLLLVPLMLRRGRR